MLGQLSNKRGVDWSDDMCIEPEQSMLGVAAKNWRSRYSSH